MKRRILTLLAVFTVTALILLFFNKVDNNVSQISKTDFYFDTAVTITIYNSKESYVDKCFEMCKNLEKKFSSQISDSEISMINSNSKDGKFTTVSDETIELLEYGLEYGEKSDGRFDITIGELSRLWNITGENPKVPDDSTINDLITDIDYSDITINGNDVLLNNPKASLDLGGIAKGYIADKIKEYLVSKNVKSGIINLGGNVLLIGSKPDGSSFNIGIQYPFGASEKTIAIVNTNNTSIVTSGIYERYFYENDKLYHHILDTKTGYPAENDLLSVTIISDNSVTGDALSTAVFTMGFDEGIGFIENTENVEAIFVDTDYNVHITSGLEHKENIIRKKQSKSVI